MKQIQHLLWVLDLVIAAGIVVVGCALVMPAEPVRLPEIDTGRRPLTPSPPTGHWMRDARNPLTPATDRIESPVSAVLQGTNAAEDRAWGFAYLLVGGHPVTVDLGEAVPHMAGWVLARVTASTATLSNGGQEMTLGLDNR